MCQQVTTTSATQQEVINMLVKGRSFCEGRGDYLPSMRNIPAEFYVKNSGIFVSRGKISTCPKGTSIPPSVCKAVLLAKGFHHIDYVTDNDWLSNMAYHYMSDEQRVKTTFTLKDADLMERLLRKGDGHYIIPATVLPELLELARNMVPERNGGARRKCIEQFGTSPVEVAGKLLEGFSLRTCFICRKGAKNLWITRCCKRAVHYKCALGKQCQKCKKPGSIFLEKAKHWKRVYKPSTESPEQKIRRYMEKIEKVKAIAGKRKDPEVVLEEDELILKHGQDADNIGEEVKITKKDPQNMPMRKVGVYDSKVDKGESGKPVEVVSETSLSDESLRSLYFSGRIAELSLPQFQKIFKDRKLRMGVYTKAEIISRLREYLKGKIKQSFHSFQYCAL
eukprot:TRINITY_DN8675_c0_g1_i2.p1 TRINITY_DN8675_c0_g1~~TRINITY_DN8675_c0_g1_i2.p1  ORF type:complete len:393 (+),score=17.64 TRINITY_DN8675_c0_g1_i2:1036-2214(+)